MASTASGNKELQFPQSAYNYYYNNNQKSKISASNYYYKGAVPQLSEVYASELGKAPTPAIMRQMYTLTESGQCTPDMIAAVIEYTAVTAPAPSWAYARYVINAQIAAGRSTREEFETACMIFRKKRTKTGKRVIEQEYSQREYGKELDGPSAEEIAEARTL